MRYVFILIPGHSVPQVERPWGVGADQEGGGHVNHRRLPPRQERVQTGQRSYDSHMTVLFLSIQILSHEASFNFR